MILILLNFYKHRTFPSCFKPETYNVGESAQNPPMQLYHKGYYTLKVQNYRKFTYFFTYIVFSSK